MNEIKKLFEIVGHRKVTLYIMMLSIVVAMIEFVGLALIVPYISIATQQVIPESEYLKPVLMFFHVESFIDFMTFMTIAVVGFYILRLIVNLFFGYISLRFINMLRHVIMSKLFVHYAHIDYAHFVFRNSSDLKKTLLAESLSVQNMLKAMIDIVSESFIIFFLLGLIFYTDWKLSMALLVLFSVMFYAVTFLLKKKINFIAGERKEFARGIHKEVDETLSNFKFAKLIGAENVKIDLFNKNSYGLYRVNTLFGLLSQSPKYILETMGLLTIIGVVFYLVQIKSSEAFIATLGVYAIAFYRMLPSLNKIITSFNTFQYFKNTIDQVYDDLMIDRESYTSNDPVVFNDKIELKNIGFQYEGSSKRLFEKFDLVITKGEKVALIGSSGSGKSTLVDILMGVLKVSDGKILVDGKEIDETNMKSWRNKFGYIPQEIYLYDSSVADNVAFGREYEEERVIAVLKQANIYEFLQTKDGINTIVGEGGVQLSGGQKQRIGIARALYHAPEILVLDEATSALDNDTEEKIMDEIYRISKDKTLIVIAHRLSTIERCERKIILEKK